MPDIPAPSFLSKHKFNNYSNATTNTSFHNRNAAFNLKGRRGGGGGDGGNVQSIVGESAVHDFVPPPKVRLGSDDDQKHNGFSFSSSSSSDDDDDDNNNNKNKKSTGQKTHHKRRRVEELQHVERREPKRDIFVPRKKGRDDDDDQGHDSLEDNQAGRTHSTTTTTSRRSKKSSAASKLPSWTLSRNKPKSERRSWTAAEIKALTEGIVKYGYGEWDKILNSGSGVFKQFRTSNALLHKARYMGYRPEKERKKSMGSRNSIYAANGGTNRILSETKVLKKSRSKKPLSKTSSRFDDSDNEVDVASHQNDNAAHRRRNGSVKLGNGGKKNAKSKFDPLGDEDAFSGDASDFSSSSNERSKSTKRATSRKRKHMDNSSKPRQQFSNFDMDDSDDSLSSYDMERDAKRRKLQSASGARMVTLPPPNEIPSEFHARGMALPPLAMNGNAQGSLMRTGGGESTGGSIHSGSHPTTTIGAASSSLFSNPPGVVPISNAENKSAPLKNSMEKGDSSDDGNDYMDVLL
mmetsp:Transcript_5887/g.22325  ORF Transcript_5887/g.22325 Transcript_5887/m.22325 type:complete len:520 (-) Transcript_5887:183-1742(-)